MKRLWIALAEAERELGLHITEEQIDELARKCSHDHSRTIGTIRTLNEEDMKAIYRMAR